MSDISNTQNLNAHYTDKTKVVRPEHFVVEAPNTIPSHKIYDDFSANKKMKTICNDIYVGTQKEKKSESKNFAKICGAGLIGILGFLGIRKLFK